MTAHTRSPVGTATAAGRAAGDTAAADASGVAVDGGPGGVHVLPGLPERARAVDARSAHQPVIAAACRIVTLLNEVVAGVRPARVVLPLFAVHLRGPIRRAGRRWGPVPGVHRLALSRTVDDAYEVVAVCRRGRRFDAVGLRLERTADGWLVTDVAHPVVRVGRPPHLSDPPCDRPLHGGSRR